MKKEPGQVDVSDSTGRVISLLLCRLCFAFLLVFFFPVVFLRLAFFTAAFFFAAFLRVVFFVDAFFLAMVFHSKVADVLSHCPTQRAGTVAAGQLNQGVCLFSRGVGLVPGPSASQRIQYIYRISTPRLDFGGSPNCASTTFSDRRLQ